MNTSEIDNPFIMSGSTYNGRIEEPKIGHSELNRIGRWRAFMKGRRFWTETDEDILRIILDLIEKSSEK